MVFRLVSVAALVAAIGTVCTAAAFAEDQPAEDTSLEEISRRYGGYHGGHRHCKSEKYIAYYKNHCYKYKHCQNYHHHHHHHGNHFGHGHSHGYKHGRKHGGYKHKGYRMAEQVAEAGPRLDGISGKWYGGHHRRCYYKHKCYKKPVYKWRTKCSRHNQHHRKY